MASGMLTYMGMWGLIIGSGCSASLIPSCVENIVAWKMTVRWKNHEAISQTRFSIGARHKLLFAPDSMLAEAWGCLATGCNIRQQCLRVAELAFDSGAALVLLANGDAALGRNERAKIVGPKSPLGRGWPECLESRRDFLAGFALVIRPWRINSIWGIFGV